MKILITGSNGLLGQKLVQLLVQQTGVELLATAVGPNRLHDTSGYTYCSMDITKPSEINAVFEQFKPSHVIHTAAMTNVDQCEEDPEGCELLNVKAVEYLIDACRAHGSFLCHLSTDFIFDGEAGPYTEEGIPNPVSVYGESKLKAEQLVENSGLEWSIARTILVYGIVSDMSRTNIILWVKKSLEDGKEIKVVTDQFRSPTLAEDLAMGCWLIVQSNAKGIFNISGKETLTPYEMALKTAEFFNLDKSLIHKADSSTFTQKAKRPARTGFIITKAEKLLGYQPHSFEEGIRVVAEQMR